MTMFRWIAGPVPADLRVRQVYGYCFTDDGRVLLRDDSGRFGLPGGKPEPGEDAPAVLARECLEESQITVSTPVYVGYQEVTEDGGQPPYAQLRLAARIIDLVERHTAAGYRSAQRYGRSSKPLLLETVSSAGVFPVPVTR